MNKYSILAFWTLVLFLSGCQGSGEPTAGIPPTLAIGTLPPTAALAATATLTPPPSATFPPTATLQSTATLRATATLIPSATPLPSSTPVPPTPIPSATAAVAQPPPPTATLEPTATQIETVVVVPSTFILPVRPQPLPFEPTAVLNSLIDLRAQIEELGGVFDRSNGGAQIDCRAFYGAFYRIGVTPVFNELPPDWALVHQDYLRAADTILNTSRPFFDVCADDTVVLSDLAYGIARTAVNEEVERLITAINAASNLP